MNKLTIALILLAATVAILPSWNDIFVSADSVNYISTAVNLTKGRLCNYTGKLELAHPPGYAFAMAPFVLVGVPPQTAAKIVNWLSLVLVGCFAWLIIRDTTGLKDWKVTAVALCCEFNSTLFLFANTVLSEAIMAAEVFMFAWLCIKATAHDHDDRWVWFASLCGLVMCFTRYPGLSVVLGAGVFMRSWRDKAIVILPSFLSVGTMFLITKAMTPYFTSQGKSLSVTIGNMLNVPNSLVKICSSTIVAALLVYLVIEGRKWLSTRILAGIVTCYALGLMAMVLVNNFNPSLDARLYVPISGVIFLLLGLLSLRRMPIFAPYLLAGMLAYVTLFNVGEWGKTKPPERKDLNRPMFKNSGLMQFIRELPDTVPVYTNCGSVVWLYTGKATPSIPSSSMLQDHQSIYSTREDIERTGGWLIWFRHQSPLYDQPEKFRSLMVDAGNGRIIGAEDSSGMRVLVRKAER